MGQEIIRLQNNPSAPEFADFAEGNSDLPVRPETQAMVWGLLCEMLVTVMRQGRGNNVALQPTEAMKGHLAPVIDFLNTNYSKPLSLEEVAKKFGITASHLSRTFKIATRFGFVEYINNLRVSESCRLLRTTKLSVLEIALKCGFGSVTQFGRCFRELTGVSPRAYRKNIE